MPIINVAVTTSDGRGQRTHSFIDVPRDRIMTKLHHLYGKGTMVKVAEINVFFTCPHAYVYRYRTRA